MVRNSRIEAVGHGQKHIRSGAIPVSYARLPNCPPTGKINMPLINAVSVAKRFQKAVRIDIDLSDPKALEGFVCPNSSAEVLQSMADHIQHSQQAAFTWTGPYGSGKSTLAIALSSLLARDTSVRENAASIIGQTIASPIWDALKPGSASWTILPVVGSRENAISSIARALTHYEIAPETKEWTEASILEVISSHISMNDNRLLLFVDEMGKFLEAAAFGHSDVHIFQQLAELASRSNGKFVLIGVLHQSFSNYGKRLSKELRDEWTKIQGRFIDLTVNASGEEQIELLSRAIHTDEIPDTYQNLSQTVFQSVKDKKQNTSMSMATSLAACWPLHPVTACLLGPISKRRFGQNQRSIFGFLNSAEPNGFQDFLKQADKSDIYTPDMLWDYLRQNLESAILASPDGHRWSIAVEAIERSESFGADLIDLKVIKTLALIDLLKENSGVLPSRAILVAATLISEGRISKSLDKLSNWSVIIYRNFLDSYAVFAGSDFDIENAVESALLEIGEVDCKLLTELAGIHPILAKKYYHQTGTLRWFDVELAHLADLDEVATDFIPEKGTIGKFIFALPNEEASESDVAKTCNQLSLSHQTNNIIVGLSAHAWSLQDRAKELIALEYVRENSPELSGDSVARREVNARLAAQKEILENDLHKALETAQWFYAGNNGHKLKYSELNSLASDLSQKTYPYCPIIKNELINRHKASSSGVAAQNVLLKQMALNAHLPKLGLEGYAAETGIYASVLQATGLHSQRDNVWGFHRQKADNDPFRLAPLWEHSEAFLNKNSDRSVNLTELYDLWRGKPFGIRDGLMPILAVSFILSTKDTIALYRDNIYQSAVKRLDIEYLSMSPDSIQLRWVDLSESSRTLLSGMADIVQELSPDHISMELSPIEVARGIISVFDKLHPWTLRTAQLSQNAKRLREVCKKAHDPNQLIFNDLPSFANNNTPADLQSDEGIKQIIANVTDGLNELSSAYPNMLQDLYSIIFNELGVPNKSQQSLRDLNQRAANIKGIAGDFKLDAFAGRLTNFQGSEDDISSIASLVISKPLNNWIDTDVDRAKIELAKIAQKFNQAEAFAHVKGRKNNRKSVAVVIGQDGTNDTLHSEFNLSKQEQKQVSKLSKELSSLISQKSGYTDNIILGALADLLSQQFDNNK
jgi:energy-coupling factor transporter ATP-binding protein EcfA2